MRANKKYCGEFFFISTTHHFSLINDGPRLVFTIHYLRCFLCLCIFIPFDSTAYTHSILKNSILTYSSYFFASFSFQYDFAQAGKRTSTRNYCVMAVKVRCRIVVSKNETAVCVIYVSSCNIIRFFVN